MRRVKRSYLFLVSQKSDPSNEVASKLWTIVQSGRISVITKELNNLEKYFIRAGNNINSIRKVLGIFHKKIERIIEIEEKLLFLYLEPHTEKDGPLFVMAYAHDIIKNEIKSLESAINARDIYKIHKSGTRLLRVYRSHIKNEYHIILERARECVKNHPLKTRAVFNVLRNLFQIKDL